MRLRPNAKPDPENFKIGSFDAGLTDLSDKVTVRHKREFATREAALQYAQQLPGAEMIVEQREGGELGYDVYSVNIHDRDQRLTSPQQMKHLSLMSEPLENIESMTGKKTQRAFFVTQNGQETANIYDADFDRTIYDRLRAGLGLDDSKHWFQLVDKYMTAPSPADDIPPIDNAEIQDMKSQLQAGDIIMTGNNGSFIHAIVYVGEDPALQAQLEVKWGLEAGTLDGEGLILHSLAADHDAEIEVNGQKEYRAAGGVGVIIDTIERYNERNPRDTMIAVEVNGATEADRKAVVAEGKKMVGRGYDNGFNTFDDKDIYCTEFVYKAWLAAPDTDADFQTQLHPLVPQTSAPVSGWLYDKMPDSIQQSMKDDGYLYQEMIMTDGIITSPNVRIKWANPNVEQSQFVQKHERWADGLDGKISRGYQALIEDTVPEQAARSRSLLSDIRSAAEQSQTRLNRE